MRALARIGEAFGGETDPLGVPYEAGPFGEGPQRAAEWLQAFGPMAEDMEETTAFKLATGQEIEPADLSAYNELRQPPGGIHDQIAASIDEAKLQQGLFATTMRYTGQALSYAYEAMQKGDPDWQRFLKDSEGNVVMAITDKRWDYGPMWENMSPIMRDRIEEMGFVQVEPGLRMIPTFEEPGYGMGGYEFPGYGGFGGGYGGDYEYLSRGGQQRRKRGGGVSTGERYRVFPEGVPPAHWRI
jgi:hypothetical protein